MKQKLLPKLDLKQKNTYNTLKANSLKVLSLSTNEMIQYFREYAQYNPSFGFVSNQESDADAFLQYDTSQPSLYDEIIKQLSFYDYDPELIDSFFSEIDSNGYFKKDYASLKSENKVSQAQFDAHLSLLRNCEPYGCFAFSLKDCLQLQCLHSDSLKKDLAYQLCEHLEDAALRRFDKIADILQVNEDEIVEAFHFIQTLNPKPASSYSTLSTYLSAEFIIEVNQQTIDIKMTEDDFHLELNEFESENKEYQAFMKKQLSEARQMMAAYEKRKLTLMMIMKAICEIQKDFFLTHKPLVHCTLEMVAKKTGLHISTVSRAISQKSCEFEHQYYPLKYFFVSGGSCSHTKKEIKEAILEILKNEKKDHPYSDMKIKKELEKKGIVIARRTVAKYREQLYLFNSSQRRNNKIHQKTTG